MHADDNSNVQTSSMVLGLRFYPGLKLVDTRLSRYDVCTIAEQSIGGPNVIHQAYVNYGRGGCDSCSAVFFVVMQKWAD